MQTPYPYNAYPLLDKPLLDRLFQESFDTVVHLAAYVGVRPSIVNPRLYQQVNVEGTVNILECCRANKIPKLVFASSSSVYGGRETVPFKETDDIMKPISPYAATKVAGEALCYTYHHLFGLAVSMLRFFTVYGPRQRPEMAIALFAKQLQEGQTLTLFGQGITSRDYTYIDDILDGIEASIEHCSGCEVFNLGNSRPTSLMQLVFMLAEHLGVEPRVSFLPEQPGDVPITYADVSKVKAMLNYDPKVSIDEGLARFCQWLKVE